MKLVLDTHIHTTASGHAYSSLQENVKAAKDRGLSLMAVTDHSPGMPGSAHIFHFQNLRVLPPYIDGIRVLKGVEANISDFNGNLDLDEEVLAQMELVVASMHIVCIKPGNRKQNAYMLRMAMENPFVSIIGHPDDARYEFDKKEFIKACGETGTLPEINNTSLLPTSFRQNSRETISELLEICADLDQPVVLGSDAHYSANVGEFSAAMKLIKELKFPQNLILNGDVDAFLKHIAIKRGPLAD